MHNSLKERNHASQPCSGAYLPCLPIFTEICSTDDFNCGSGFCVDSEAECDGFNDCLNNAEEITCGKHSKTIWRKKEKISNPVNTFAFSRHTVALW